MVEANGFGLGGGGPLFTLGLLAGWGLVGGRGLTASMFDEDWWGLSPSKLRLSLVEREYPSLGEESSDELEVGSSDEATLSVATV